MKSTSADSGEALLKRYIEEDDSGDVAADLSADEDYFPPAKRRKSRDSMDSSKVRRLDASKGKRKAETKICRGRIVGKLERMLQMPIDIFCEIAAHLEPLDLLHLARSSKSFNQMLMSRSAKPFWRMARSSCINLPDCPPDLSEPAYARLLFEKTCHMCLAPRAVNVYYVLRIRLCRPCRSTNIAIVKGTVLLTMVPGLTTELLECIPSRRLGSDLDRTSHYFSVVQAGALVAKFYAAIPEDISEREKSVVRDEFYAKHQELAREVEKHAADIESWFVSDNSARQMRGVYAARRREASLRAKLVELGHSEADFPDRFRDYEWFKIMDQPRDLTPRTWTKVRPKLEACIVKEKERRAQERRPYRQAQIMQHLLNLVIGVVSERKKRDNRLAMSYENASLLPSCAALHDDKTYPEEITSRIIAERWDAARGQIEKEMDDFAVSARTILKDLVLASQRKSSKHDSTSDDTTSSTKPSVEGGADGDEDLETLRSAYFQCRACASYLRQGLNYPSLLEHKHPVTEMTFDVITSSYANRLLSSFTGEQRDEDLCALGSQLRCLRCDEATHPMSWLQLIDHFRSEQNWYSRELLRKTDDSSSAKVKLHHDHAFDDQSTPAFAVLDAETVYFSPEPIAHCNHCTWSRGQFRTKEQVISHIRRNHLKEPEFGDIEDIDAWSYY